MSGRFDPAILECFRAHREDWEAGRILLMDHVEDWIVHRDGTRTPLWYALPLGRRVVADKARVFSLVGYKPSLPAVRFHASCAKVKVFSGGARAGKSLAGAMEMVPVLLTPGTRQWIVGPEYEQCRKEFEYILANTIEHPAIGKTLKPIVKRVANRPHQGDMEIRLDWGDAGESFVIAKSAGRMTSLLSEELDVVCIVEAAEVPELAWKRYLAPRLITRQGIALIPSSPYGLGWVAQLYDQGIAGKPGYFAVNADSRTNPTVSEEEVKFWAAEMSDEDWSEQVEGKPMPKHGLVYPGFNRDLHVASWQPDWPRPSWRRGRAIDFGFTDPFVVLWIAEDEDRRLYVYRELYRSKMLVQEVVQRIADAEGWELGKDPKTGRVHLVGLTGKADPVRGPTIADWDAQGRAELRSAGILARRALKSVLDGIRAVQGLLRVREDGRPRLFIAPGCVHTIREFRKYAWDKRAETPKDGDDHAMDALRYFVLTTQPRTVEMRIEAV